MSAARKKSRRKKRPAAATPSSKQAAPAKTTPSSSTKWIALAAIALAVALATWLWKPDAPATSGPAAVRPLHPDDMDPLVAELVERHVQEVGASPASAAAHGELGLVYAANELLPEARDSLRNAVELDPDNRLWRFHLALATRRAGDAASARELLVRLAADEPSFAPVHQRLGEALLQAGDLAGARAAYARVTELEPGAPDGPVGTAEIAIRERRYEDAVADLQRALALDGEFRVAFYLLGLAYRGLGETDKAEENLARGLGAPRRYLADAGTQRQGRYAVNLMAQINRSGLLLQAGDVAGAIGLLEEALRKRGDEVRLLNTLAMAYLRTNQLDRAEGLLQRARAADPDALATEMNLASLHLRRGDFTEALRWADAAAARAPQVSQVHVARALVLERLGRRAEALDAARRAARLETDNPKHQQLVERLSQ